MLQIEINLTPHRQTELVIIKLLQAPKKLDIVKIINVIFVTRWDKSSTIYAAMGDTIPIMATEILRDMIVSLSRKSLSKNNICW